jgi:hypothetical protein
MKTPPDLVTYWAAMVACSISTAANFWKTNPEIGVRPAVSNFVQTPSAKERILHQ